MRAKRIMAVLLAAAMVVGGSVTALADNETSGSGGTSGTGTSNGHFEAKLVSVTLPTNVSTTFNYIADPEDLVGQTKDSTSNKGKTKTGTEVLANADLVYFHNAEIAASEDDGISSQNEGYSSTSDKARVINKSSVSINLTAIATVSENANNMAIANAKADLATATSTPTMHFDLLTKKKGGTDTTTPVSANSAGTAASAKVEIELGGSPNNFELAQTGTGAAGKYTYTEKTGIKNKDYEYVDISLAGACSKATTTDDLVAPVINLTWAWTDPSVTPTIELTTGGVATITNASCTSAQLKSLYGVLSPTERYAIDGTNATITDPSTGTITIALGSKWRSSIGKKIKVTAVFADDTEAESNEVTLASVN